MMAWTKVIEMERSQDIWDILWINNGQLLVML